MITRRGYSLARYEINGGRPLNGTVNISGAKNAVVAILPAALLVKGKCRIENVPNISDVQIMAHIMHLMVPRSPIPRSTFWKSTAPMSAAPSRMRIWFVKCVPATI